MTLRFARSVRCHGRGAQQWLAEQNVTLVRPCIKDRGVKRETVPGPPVALRLVISQVRREAGIILACWYLLSKVPGEVSAETLALWYYWRWQIECFHKLLKGAGWHIEEWQQASACAAAKRLAVVSMAAALVRVIEPCRDPQIEPLRQELIRLSGRQMKRTRPVTAPALLAGLGALLSAMELLERCTPDELRQLAQQAMSLLARP